MVRRIGGGQGLLGYRHLAIAQRTMPNTTTTTTAKNKVIITGAADSAMWKSH
jgi:hypothetical protein